MNTDYNKLYKECEKEESFIPDEFNSPEDISKAVLDVDVYTTQAINKDSTRGNLNPKELRQVRADGALILEIEEAEGLSQLNNIDLDLSLIKRKTAGQQGLVNNTSRSKHAFALVLAKTDKHINIQSTEAYAEQINQDFNEQVSQSFGDKVANKFPFLKKKEM